MHRGYVKLWRRIEDSELWDILTPLEFKLWLWILMKANYKTRALHNITLHSGEFITTYADIILALSTRRSDKEELTGPSLQTVRTAFKWLTRLKLVTKQQAPQRGGLVVKVLHWEQYQQDNVLSETDLATDPSNRPLTDLQQTCNRPATSTKKVKNVEEEKTRGVSPLNGKTSEAVREIFDHWRKVMDTPRSKLDSARTTKIEARLRDGYSIEELKQAIDGCKASAWHMGANPDRKVFNDLNLILRDASHVEEFTRSPAKTEVQRLMESVGL